MHSLLGKNRQYSPRTRRMRRHQSIP